MFKISGDPDLVSKWQNLITAFAKRPFKFGDNKEKYSSIDDILDNLDVEVELTKGKEIYRIKKKELDAIEKFWDNVFNSEEIKEFNIQQILDECNEAEKNNDEDDNTGEVYEIDVEKHTLIYVKSFKKSGNYEYVIPLTLKEMILLVNSDAEYHS